MFTCRLPLMLAAWLACAGCYRPVFTQCGVTCGPAGECPGGLSCVQGQCTGSMSCDSGTAESDASEARDADGDERNADDATADSDATDVGDAAVDGQRDPDASADGAATDGPDATGPWTPAALPGVVLWLEADWGVNLSPGTDAISRWSDRSGHRNDAIPPDLQTTPRIIFDGIGHSPSLRFADPSWMFIIDNPSLQWGVGDFTLMIVGRTAPSCARCYAQQAFFHKSESAEPYIGLQVYLMLAEGKLRAFLAPGHEVFTDRGGYHDAAAHLFGVRRSGMTVNARVDGVTAGNAPPRIPVNLDALGRHAQIGAHGYNDDLFQFEGDIAAMIAVKGTLADDDVARLEAYLLMKYDIPGTSPPSRD